MDDSSVTGMTAHTDSSSLVIRVSMSMPSNRRQTKPLLMKMPEPGFTRLAFLTGTGGAGFEPAEAYARALDDSYGLSCALFGKISLVKALPPSP